MAGYFIGMHKYLRMIKAFIATVSSAEFNTMSLNSKLSKGVSYIQDNKAWERIYVLLRIIFTFCRVLCIADSNKAEMEKLFYYSIMKNISIIKSSSDLDNKELFLVSSSSPFKAGISSDSDTEDKDNIDTDDPDIIDSDMLVSLSSSICKYGRKEK